MSDFRLLKIWMVTYPSGSHLSPNPYAEYFWCGKSLHLAFNAIDDHFDDNDHSFNICRYYNTNPDMDRHKSSLNDELDFCPEVLWIPLPAYMHPETLVSCQSAVIMRAKTPWNVGQRRYSIAARGQMNIQRAMLFYVCIASLAARPVFLLKRMTVASSSNASICCIHTGDDQPYMLNC